MKAEILSFTGGKRCKECGEQIEPERVRISYRVSRCAECQSEFEGRLKRARWASRPRDIEIIRG